MKFAWNLFILWVISTIRTENAEEATETHKEKRQINSLPLVFPYGSIYKLIIGLSMPVPVEDHIKLAFAANFQYQYAHFTNISQLSQYYFIKTVSREQREADMKARKDERLTFYKSVAEMLDTKGMNGMECVLRAICEAAQYPVDEDGFMGEILHILLTPDYGRVPFDVEDPEWEESMSRYKNAAISGRQMFSCDYIFSGCPEGQGVMELITTLRN